MEKNLSQLPFSSAAYGLDYTTSLSAVQAELPSPIASGLAVARAHPDLRLREPQFGRVLVGFVWKISRRYPVALAPIAHLHPPAPRLVPLLLFPAEKPQ